MATLYTVVYEKFLGKITDYSFANLTDLQLGTIMKGYLVSAIPRFIDCKHDLSLRDNTALTANLTDEESEILASLMVVEWLNPQINSTRLVQQAIGEKDFRMTSQASHLDSLLALRTDAKAEAADLIMRYTFVRAEIEEMNR